MSDTMVHLISHPLVQHKLTMLRRRETHTAEFRILLRELGFLMTYEVTRELQLTDVQIQTPLKTMQAPVLAGKKLCFTAILRAGMGLLDGMLQLLPSARVGHIGLYREPKTLEVVDYYFKVPNDLSERFVIVVDPMLATGHSGARALSLLKEAGADQISLLCLLACPEGLEYIRKAHPDVLIYTASVDEGLDDHAYIIPGLGDAGDRMYGTQ